MFFLSALDMWYVGNIMVLFVFLAAPFNLWDLSSVTKD